MNKTPPKKRRQGGPPVDNRDRRRPPTDARGRRRPPTDARGKKRPPANGRRGRSLADRTADRAAYRRSLGMPKRRSKAIMFIAGIIFVIVVAYIFDSVTKLSNRVEIPSESITMGTMDVPMIFNGIIIRNESVYTAPTAGVVTFSRNDLDRVSRGAEICRIEDGQASEEAAARIEDIERAILRIQERRSDISAFRRDLDNIYLQVKNIVDNRALPSLQTDFSVIYEVKDAITSNMNLRNQIIMNEERGSLSTLVNERQHYENELNMNSEIIYAEESGVLSYVVDGMEGSLTFERLSSLTPEETRMSVDYSQMVRIREVEEDEPVFKVITSNEWYIAAYIPMEYVFDWMEDEPRTIYIQEGGDYSPVDMRIETIIEGDDEYYVLFRSTKNMVDYIHMRDVRFKITDSRHSGYKIPTAAIVDLTLLKVPKEYMIDDDGNFLMKRFENGDDRISVRSLYSDSDFYYVFQEIGKLELNDEIRRPEEPHTVIKLSDVQNVKGVYVVNRGFAEFKRITLDPRIPALGEYVVLDPARNPELRLHDRISTDSRTISPQQIIVD